MEAVRRKRMAFCFFRRVYTGIFVRNSVFYNQKPGESLLIG